MSKRISGCLAVGLFASSALAQVVPATHQNLIYEGRHHKDYHSGNVQVNWPGSRLKTGFVGTKLTITMQGYGDHYDLLIDGELKQTLITQASGAIETFLLFQSSSAKAVTVELIKRTENTLHMTKFISFHHDGKLDSTLDKKPHILFIGDSISAGLGAESNKRECTWEETYASSNARLAFPNQTARQLDATMTQISFSGLGLIRNWGGNQTHHDLTSYTDKVSAIHQLTLDYEDIFPNLIVIEVGTNDFSTDPQAHEPWKNIEEVKEAWTKRLVEYVSELKQRYHQVPIVFMSRPAYPYDYIVPATHDAINALNQQAISLVYNHTFSSPFEGCNWHPTAREHYVIATHLAQYIRDQSLLIDTF
ncbi:lipolytic enzyme [Vibrio vulnificus]|nr:lipolytic enzyme [Vibrio vulnificus]